MANLEKTVGPTGLQTWVASDGRGRVELVPARGGLVTRWSVGGDEVLYLDEATLLDPTKNVRGGIPLLFPFPGKAPPGSPLGQHGFARKLPWEMVEAAADEDTARLECELRSTPETHAGFPYDFALRFAVTVADGRLTLEWRLTNTGASTLPLHFGIHPYFRVPLATKAGARVDHKATRAWDNVRARDVDVGELRLDGPEVDVHLLDHPTTATTLHRGDGKRVQLSWTPQFTTLVVWTQPGKEFVCVEPWTAPGGALTTGLARPVAPGAVEQLAVVMALE
jgi:galactose mutarotase-like enzyme